MTRLGCGVAALRVVRNFLSLLSMTMEETGMTVKWKEVGAAEPLRSVELGELRRGYVGSWVGNIISGIK